MNIPTREQLIAAQLREYPDSVIVTLDHVLNEWATARITEEDRSEARTRYWVVRPQADPWLDEALAQGVANQRAARILRSVVVAQSYHPEVVFYECGRDAQGNTKWRGARFGVEGSQYASGFGRY